MKQESVKQLGFLSICINGLYTSFFQRLSKKSNAMSAKNSKNFPVVSSGPTAVPFLKSKSCEYFLLCDIVITNLRIRSHHCYPTVHQSVKGEHCRRNLHTFCSSVYSHEIILKFVFFINLVMSAYPVLIESLHNSLFISTKMIVVFGGSIADS